MDDLKLIESLKADHIPDYEALVYQYTGYVIAVVRKVGGGQLSEQDIEEVTSDTFAKLWEKRKTLLIQEGKLKSYLGVMARHLTINYLKKYYKWKAVPLEEYHAAEGEPKDEHIPSGVTSLEGEIIKKEERTQLVEAIKDLGEPDTEIFIRRYFYFEKVTGIAKALALNEQTVATRLYRGKEKLKKMLVERGI